MGRVEDWPLGYIQHITDKAEFCKWVKDKTCNKCGEKGHLANAPHKDGAFIEHATKAVKWGKDAKDAKASCKKKDRPVDEGQEEKRKIRAFIAQIDAEVSVSEERETGNTLTVDNIFDQLRASLYTYNSGGAVPDERMAKYAAFAAQLGAKDKDERLAQLQKGVVLQGLLLTEREIKGTWKALLATMGLDNNFAIVLLDSGTMGSSVITPKQCEALGIMWEQVAEQPLTGIGEASIIGQTVPMPVTLADKTGKITFAVTSATLLYPLVIAGDYVPHWGEPLFAKDLKSLRVDVEPILPTLPHQLTKF